MMVRKASGPMPSAARRARKPVTTWAYPTPPKAHRSLRKQRSLDTSSWTTACLSTLTVGLQCKERSTTGAPGSLQANQDALVVGIRQWNGGATATQGISVKALPTTDTATVMGPSTGPINGLGGHWATRVSFGTCRTLVSRTRPSIAAAAARTIATSAFSRDNTGRRSSTDRRGRG